MKKLDIFVTHYREPWEVCRKFFQMLALQREVGWDEIGVTLIHDGEDIRFDDSLFDEFPYAVRQISIPHGGVSAARNRGLDEADAEWINFCDCDDMYSGAFSLWRVLRLMDDAGSYDILCGEFMSEFRLKDGSLQLFRREQPDCVFVHAKYFRTAFLRENGLRFPVGQEYNEDSAFVSIAYTMTETERVGQIETGEPIYIWCCHGDSTTRGNQNLWKPYAGGWRRNRDVCDAYRERLGEERYRSMVSRTVYDAYYQFNLEEMPDGLRPYMEEFQDWLPAHMDSFNRCSRKNRIETALAAKRQHDAGVYEASIMAGGNPPLRINREKTFGVWLKEMISEGERRYHHV